MTVEERCSVTTSSGQGRRLLVCAFEGWNDAGEAASDTGRLLAQHLGLTARMSVDPELYFDYQFTRPIIRTGESGVRRVEWPGATLFGPAPPSPGEDGASVDPDISHLPAPPSPGEDEKNGRADCKECPAPPSLGEDNSDRDHQLRSDNTRQLHVLLGAEPARSWRAFVEELLDAAAAVQIDGIILLGAMLADAPHTRPLTVLASSENATQREIFGLERSTYEGPVGILSVLAEHAELRGIPTVSLWVAVPHYVHSAPSPKAMLALVTKLEELFDLTIPLGSLATDAAAWEAGVDAAASEDEDLAGYVAQLERARDAVDAPSASGEAIAQEFEQYLRQHDGPEGRGSPDDRADGRR